MTVTTTPGSTNGLCHVTEFQLQQIFIEREQKAYSTPLLFVHGAWHGAWCWNQGFMQYFAGRWFSVHALSLRGHGTSAGHEGLRRFRIADYVQDVSRVASTLDEPPILIGHSMGVLLCKSIWKQMSPRVLS